MNYVCAIVKDEHEYIREWILHNLSIGFEKIVLYDNNSSFSYNGVLGDKIREGSVELRFWTDMGWSSCVRAYNDFVLNGNWHENDWCAFINVDEFIYLDNCKTVFEFTDLHKNYAGVECYIKNYNINSRIINLKEKSISDAYTQECEIFEAKIKFLTRLMDIEYISSPYCIISKKKHLKTKDIFRLLTQEFIRGIKNENIT